MSKYCNCTDTQKVLNIANIGCKIHTTPKGGGEMGNFTYNAQYVTLNELVEKLQPMAKKFGIKVYSKGKALVEDFGTFKRVYYRGNWGNGFGKLVEEKLFNKEA